MPIGLTSSELADTFLQRSISRLSDAIGQFEAVKANENPQAAKLIDELKGKFPTLDIEQGMAIACIFMALMDTIAANNEALAKVIPHIDS